MSETKGVYAIVEVILTKAGPRKRVRVFTLGRALAKRIVADNQPGCATWTPKSEDELAMLYEIVPLPRTRYYKQYLGYRIPREDEYNGGVVLMGEPMRDVVAKRDMARRRAPILYAVRSDTDVHGFAQGRAAAMNAARGLLGGHVVPLPNGRYVHSYLGYRLPTVTEFEGKEIIPVSKTIPT